MTRISIGDSRVIESREVSDGVTIRRRRESPDGTRFTTYERIEKPNLAIIKKEATLDVFSLWGGIEVYVPKDIIVKNNTSVILGGVEDTTDNSVALAGAPVLYIIGDVIMAGVEIKN